ncbi:hypothetical protein HK11_12670 [Acetobacter sp. DmW_043]|uniref:hypothetical protein n=1 Tax=Acetobacter sp. DmW_043 TaxID=1670658 RepID=UPI000B5656E9|nr:hypothetical protein [Acetobacter sp. DmW_043]OUI86624.1 hypothetical protein HK11_12670 [Acetobacter sp. DmW_043]
MPFFRVSEKASSWRIFTMAGLMLSSAWAHTAAAASLAANDPYGDWVGTLVTEKGLNCPTYAQSLMQIEPHRMVFVPATGSLILRGVPNKATQHYHAQLLLEDAAHKPLPIVFEAHPSGTTFEGVYGTPECRAHITLTRPEHNAWKNFLDIN